MGVSISKSDSMILNAQHVFLYFNNPIKTSIETVKAELTQLVENTGAPKTLRLDYSTVTDFAKFRGWSTLHPRNTAMW